MQKNSLGLEKPVEKTKVCVAMSGGVDSSATAYMLKKEGYDVFGITMDLLQAPYAPKKSSISDAAIVAKHLNIPHYLVDFKQEFSKKVVDYFTSTYKAGKTPSPCIMCNKEIKLGILANTAIELGADILVTGHYAQVLNTPNGVELHRGKDLNRDQSYFLFAIDRKILEMLRCPLADYTKEQTREIAKEAGLSIHNKSDSQDICFVQNGKYAELIKELDQKYATKEGDIINRQGKVLGKHRGIIYYTVGQRRGLGIGGGDILYVLEVDAKNNTVIVGSKEELLQKKVYVRDVNWLADDLPKEMELQVKLRSRQELVLAKVCILENNRAEVILHNDFYGVAAGQGCCFYLGTRVMGGGIIEV